MEAGPPGYSPARHRALVVAPVYERESVAPDGRDHALVGLAELVAQAVDVQVVDAGDGDGAIMPRDERARFVFAQTDGSYRLMPKSVPGAKTPLALSAVGSGFATLAKFDPDSDRQHWQLKGL